VKRSRKLLWLAPAAGFTLVALPIVLIAGAGTGAPPACQPASAPTASPAGRGSWLATAYGPPWDGIQGNGVTATGLDLTSGPPAYEIAVDPTVIALRSFAHVRPNPFGTRRAFYAGDTGGAIIGQHVDIYDWQGRGAQDAWGERHVTVTPAPEPGTGNLLAQITPTDPQATGSGCLSSSGPLPITNGPAGQILPGGLAAAPTDAPAQVKRAIAAGNQIVDRPYLWGGGHGQPLTELAAGYDCSGSASYVLHGAGVLGDYAEDSGQLENYGASGAGKWITVYANSAHAFIQVAGVVMDTAWLSAVQPTNPATGPRWQPASVIAAQYASDLAAGNGGFVQRHPKGY
jgi:3D (Asp-Asp-Asp) domain-containing protein